MVRSIVPSSTGVDEAEERRRRQPASRERSRGGDGSGGLAGFDGGGGGGLLGGLVGRAVGGMLKSAVGALGEQLRQAAEQAADVQVRGAAAVIGRQLPVSCPLLASPNRCFRRRHRQSPLSLLLLPRQERAADIIESSSQLRQRLGGSVRVLPPVSQSSMSSSVNGRSSKTVTLILPVVGPSGSAQVSRENDLSKACGVFCASPRVRPHNRRWVPPTVRWI